MSQPERIGPLLTDLWKQIKEQFGGFTDLAQEELQKSQKRHYKRNLESPVKNCISVSLICLSESVKRGLILSGCDSLFFAIMEQCGFIA